MSPHRAMIPKMAHHLLRLKPSTGPFRQQEPSVEKTRKSSSKMECIISLKLRKSQQQIRELPPSLSPSEQRMKDKHCSVEASPYLTSNGVTHSGNIVKSTLPAGIDLNTITADGLWVSGIRAHMARYPNYDPNAKYYNGTASDALSSSRVSGWANPTGGFIHALHHAEWGGNHWRITGKSSSSTVSYEGGWMNNRGRQHPPNTPNGRKHLRRVGRRKRMVPR